VKGEMTVNAWRDGPPWWERLGPAAPMDTPDLLELRARLGAWERGALGDPLTADRNGLLPRYLAELRVLAGSEPDQARAAMLAAFALGPRDRGLPGAGDLGPLLGLAAGASPAAFDAVDLALAWGCGWRRPVASEHGWHARWPAAVLALAAMAGGSINQTARSLVDHVASLAEALRTGGERELERRFQSYSYAIALELATGACRCGHGTRSERAPAGSCGRPEHRLATWRPEACRLRAFVATAVRGSARLPVQGGALALSMLSGLLLEDQLLRVDVAEFRVCHVCNADAIGWAVRERRRLDVSAAPRGLYDLGRCPDCEAPSDPRRTYRLGRKNWLIVPADWGGQHQPVRRHRCPGCGNLFGTERRRCPLCDCPVRRGDRLTSVWVRLVGMRHAA
jgi:hypothetical protein